MGQGYSLTTLSSGSAGIDVPELADLTYEKSTGNARFMKSIRARTVHGVVLAKVVMKPYASMKLDSYVKAITRERKILLDIPNALPYHRVLETSSNGYLVRQWMYSSLYDRLSTRPFLEDIEKKWLAFQLLCAIRDCHSRNVYHGDIKTENCLVTSWNWLYLTDFSSSFKPTYLPEDNPADFSFYFDTSGRRTCYLAPERFLVAGEQAEGKGRVNWAMDIFSVGCVIAELFLEAPAFSLSTLFKYRKGEFDPDHAYLNRIEDKDIRELISHMIQLEPESRYSAEEYLNFWRHRAFPEYFYSFLHQYMHLMTDPSSGRSAVTAGQANLGEPDDRIDRVYHDFDKISYFLGYEDQNKRSKSKRPETRAENDLFPLNLDIPNNMHQVSEYTRTASDDGTLLFLGLVIASLRSTARATARIHAFELILAFSERLTDEAKLDRALPYVFDMLKDPCDYVKASALRTVTQILALVSALSPVNAHIFPEYIIPRLQQINPISSRSSTLFRATYASCLSTLAHTAHRFANEVQALKADGSLPAADPEAEDDVATALAYQDLYDVARADLVTFFESQTKSLLEDTNPAVRRAFLGSVASLCVFFGSAKTNDVILSHLNTYLNDQDWMLRCAFFQTIVGVATYVGGTSLEEFILPLMVQALTDPEEFVVDRVLRSLSSMAGLGLFQPSRAWELVDIVGRFTMHPNMWIREAAAQFISAATTHLSAADTQCVVVPLVRVYMKILPPELSELEVLDALKKPLPRSAYDQAITWAANVEKGIFWNSSQHLRTFSFGSLNEALPTISSKDLTPTSLSRIPKNDEDDQWLKRLRSAGMTPEDEFKLIALREYIWRVTRRKQRENHDSNPSQFNLLLALKDLRITPQTVFFDQDPKLFHQGLLQNDFNTESEKQPHTIADALLDASSMADDPLQWRRKSHYKTEWAKASQLTGVPEAADSRRGSPEALTPLGISPGRPSSDLDLRRESENGKGSLQVPRSKANGSSQPSNASSPITTDRKLVENHQRMRRNGSAIGLLSRREHINKANAEIGTTSTNAFGEVDGLYRRDGSVNQPVEAAPEQKLPTPSKFKFQAAHTYDGHDPSVLKLLDNMYLENFPVDVEEFGPVVAPLSRRQPIRRVGGQSTAGPWRPEGTLTAFFGEHTAAVTRIVVAPDHAFFITGSDDGSVKVWDSARLERNVAHRSRHTHRHGPDVKISSLTFIENTHCFISTSTDGRLNVVKVDLSGTEGSTKYGKLQVLREHQLDDGEYAVWSEHFKAEAQSVLMIATNKSRVIALELKSMRVLYRLENPVHHGQPTCFCIDRKRHWLLLGTFHGVLNLWDLRFHLRLKEWGILGGSPIHRICLHPIRGARKNRVCIAGGTGQGDVTVWDLEKMLCREAFRTSDCKESSKIYEPWKIDEDRPEGMLGRFATSLEPTAGSVVDRGVRAIAMGAHVVEEGTEPRHGFFLSAGPDRKVRFWDMDRIESSMIVSGLEDEEVKPTYSSVQPNPDLILVNERIPQSPANDKPPSRDGAVGAKATASSATKRGSSRSSKSTVVSLQQQQLLRSHLAPVLDVALLEYPYGMVISADKSGVIFVYQ